MDGGRGRRKWSYDREGRNLPARNVAGEYLLMWIFFPDNIVINLRTFSIIVMPKFSTMIKFQKELPLVSGVGQLTLRRTYTGGSSFFAYV